MDIKRIHPYVESADPEVARDFYVGVFGLEVAMDEPVLGLIAPQVPSAQLIVTPRGMETPQPDFGIDVGEGSAVDVAHERARASGMRIVYPLTNEPWGVRRFFVEDPDGRIVNVLAHLQAHADRSRLARAAYEAYESSDRQALEDLIADDFAFWSPQDARIDRATYFDRCWPNNETLVAFEFKRLHEVGDEVVVTYEAERKDGSRFRNTEILTFAGDQLSSVEVYFGWNL